MKVSDIDMNTCDEVAFEQKLGYFVFSLASRSTQCAHGMLVWACDMYMSKNFKSF